MLKVKPSIHELAEGKSLPSIPGACQGYTSLERKHLIPFLWPNQDHLNPANRVQNLRKSPLKKATR